MATNERLIIAGGPRCGKTTLANKLASTRDAFVFHTDDFIDLGWSAASVATAELFDRKGSFIIEGVATCRGLRKWLAAHPSPKPCDKLIYLDRPFVKLNPGQKGMLTGVETVFQEIFEDLLDRGVAIERR